MVEDGTGEPVWALIEVTAVVLPGMGARKCGANVSISSRDSSCNRRAAYGKLLCVATTPTFSRRRAGAQNIEIIASGIELGDMIVENTATIVPMQEEIRCGTVS
ncbi:hypothetical protein EJB05_15677, partial [Eragrostis curvula]